jgi:DNA repair exonuclease SbcCD nuclease subunit
VTDRVTLLHTADLHLDSPLRSLALRDEALRAAVETATRTAFTRIVDAALAEGDAGVLIAGDLFDGASRSARTAAFLAAETERLHEAGIAVFLVWGNHDAESRLSGLIDMPPNVHVFGPRGGSARLGEADIWVHGVSFARAHAPESLLPRFPAPVPGAVNIGLLHTSLAGAPGHDPYAPCSPAELAGFGYDYWALGHVHARRVHAEAPWIVMPGTPQGRDIGEAGPRSATRLTVAPDGITIEDVPTAAAEFRAATVDASGIDTAAALRRALSAGIAEAKGAAQAEAVILRLTLAGATPLAWALRRDADTWREIAAEEAAAQGDVWLEGLRLDVAPPDAGRPACVAPAAVEELAAAMEAIRAEPGTRGALRETLDEALHALEPARRHALAPDETAAEALLDALAAEGAELMAARLRGAPTATDDSTDDGTQDGTEDGTA